MNRKTFLIAFICVVFGMQGLFAQEAFTWSLAVVKSSQGLPFEDGVTMNNGERFSLEMSTENDCYVYLVVEDSSGKITPLFAPQFYRQVMAAEGTERLDSRTLQGEEKFYVVTSSVEQTSLHNAIEAYNREQTETTTDRLVDVLTEIHESANATGTSSVFGKPLITSVRGKKLAVQGTEYSGRSVYSQKIIINH